MRRFLDENFLLNSKAAQQLYHEFAKEMPIIDYHNHLPPDEIAADKNFENITKVWLYGDHYKWRAMRTNGVPESILQAVKMIGRNFKNGQRQFLILYVIHFIIGLTLSCRDILA